MDKEQAVEMLKHLNNIHTMLIVIAVILLLFYWSYTPNKK